MSRFDIDSHVLCGCPFFTYALILMYQSNTLKTKERKGDRAMLKKHNLVTSVLLIAIMVFGSFGAAFADTGSQGSTSSPNGEITPQYALDITLGTCRDSSTLGSTYVDATFSGIATSYTVTVTLQENYNGSWRTATGVSKTTDSISGKNSSDAFLMSSWNLQASKAYRIKAYIKDVVSGVTYTGTYYSDSF